MNIKGNENDTKGCDGIGMVQQNWTDNKKE